METKKKSQRIFYFDALRATAIFCVVTLHVTELMVKVVGFNPATLFSFYGIYELITYDSLRIGVDLFLILSGALSLGREWEIKDFLGRRFPRIIKPFVFWVIVSSLFLITMTYFMPNVAFIENFDINNILNTIYMTFRFKTPGMGHYWFFWMILGTYLIMPIVNKWLLHSELKEAEYFLALWVINTIFDYTLMTPCPVKLSYFTSPIGLVVLGYYLRHTERKIFNNKYCAIILIIAPIILMVSYSWFVIDTDMLHIFNRYSILPICEVTGVACLYKSSNYLKNPGENVKKIVTSIASCSYGMYLIQSVIIYFLGKILPYQTLHFAVEYILVFLGAFIGSWMIIYLMGKIPILNDYIGIK